MSEKNSRLYERLKDIVRLHRAHPWHGLDIGKNFPETINAYIEITPTDQIKYELDKASGILKVDRPQRFSNTVPALYGLIPQTFSGTLTAEVTRKNTKYKDIHGDEDPLDICVLAEKNVMHSDIILKAVPIGGLRMIDGDEADDKIIAVLQGDPLYGKWTDIKDCSVSILQRLIHYFITYKTIPEEGQKNEQEITDVYDKATAHDVIERSFEDYKNKYSELYKFFNDLREESE